MPISCPQCFRENPDQSEFCSYCGHKFDAASQPNNTGVFDNYPNLSASSPRLFVPKSSSFQTGAQQPFQQAALQQPLQQSVPQPPFQSVQPGVPGAGSSAILPGQGTGSIRSAFAGHGTLTDIHHSWLLNGGRTQAMDVRSAIQDMIHQRTLEGLNVTLQNLVDQSMVAEQRDYVIIKRKAATIFIYVASAGHDLYISRATTVKPALSMLRFILLVLIGVTLVFGPAIVVGVIFGIISSLTSAAASSGSAGGGSTAAIGGILFGGVISFLFLIVYIYCSSLLVAGIFISIRSWIIEKDFLAVLRPSVLTEFQRDDVALLTSVADDIIKTAVKHLGLDADKITPPSEGYQPKRRIRLI